ncbi:MAG: GH3 auxin-responsive promoter family protein [Saprospiraceae bacterium]|nr:GH3 auxin-responsive promoter family protein [Saprospiraceae bacterium]
MKKWFNKGVKLYLKNRYARIESIRNNPIEVQQKVLLSLLSRASKTEYGKQFHFDKIKTAEEFANTLPLTDYEDHKADIYKMMDGAKNVLWPGKIEWFAKSSGTTSDRSKYIPVSDDFLYKNNVASSWDTMAITYNEDPESQIFWKKSLIMGGSLSKWKHNDKINVGDISAILLHRMPAVGRPFYSPDFKTAIIDDWEEKIQLMSDLCINEDIVMFGGVPTWTIVLFKRILEKTGAKNMQEVWPNVKYYMHGGVGFDPYIDQFKDFFPKPGFKYFEIYNASEGYFAVQDRKDEKGMLLLLNNDIYYEFITMEELTNEHPKTTPLSDVEIDTNYAIVVSSSAGLWRYMPGDTVSFTSKNPYRIKVSGRTKHFINVFGEEVMVGNTDKALAETLKALPAIVSEYTVAPIFMNQHKKGGHLWMIEFEKEPDNLSAFEILLDDNLKKINSDYAAKRFKDMALSRLQIQLVPKGTFHKWMASKGKIGGQNKVPRLFNSRKYVDELQGFIGKN